MPSKDTFGQYLKDRGFDMLEVHKKYTQAMKDSPRFNRGVPLT
jgi:hypothetical protein